MKYYDIDGVLVRSPDEDPTFRSKLEKYDQGKWEPFFDYADLKEKGYPVASEDIEALMKANSGKKAVK